MSQAFPDPGLGPTGSVGAAALFSYELRREGRPVAILRGRNGLDGAVTVETEIFPVTAPANSEPQRRPYAFPSRDLAMRFVDEAVLALEYLGCTLAEPELRVS